MLLLNCVYSSTIALEYPYKKNIWSATARPEGSPPTACW
jgi:hypothetical protein